ncbi:MAG: dehydrogenase [Lentisphaerae bacterium GWF2_52_8]|nr:MAG: dehydrogenase [Lentisphaerae bacterium GWF2_52_8]
MRKYAKASEIKVGVIGYGGAFNMGLIHLNQMKDAGMTPYAVAEIDKERLKAAEKDFPGIKTYASVAEMLKKSKLDLAVIITPHNTHAKLGLQCLKAGCSVVCEKPLAISTAECDAMIAEAKKRRLILSTYHNRHWDGSIMEALKRVKAGEIGELVRIEAHMGGWSKPKDWWRSSRSISGGILYDWGVHLLEYSLQLLQGAELTEVSGFAKCGFWGSQTKWGKDANEDEAYAVARFHTGQWLTLCISSVDSKPKEGMLEITGTKGSYIMNYGDWKKITHSKNGTTVSESGPNPESQWPRFYQNIADHLVKGDTLIITPEWSRRPIHILDLACKSAKQGKTLKAKYK